MNDASKNQLPELDDVIHRARGEQPFGAPRDYGFEARLRQSIYHSAPGTIDVFSTLCWRLSLACVPVIVPAMVIIALLNSRQMLEELSSAFGIISGFSSFNTLSIF